MVEPLPCPFCESAPINVIVDPDIESVVCNSCHATGPSLLSGPDHESEEAMLDAAIAAWNKRGQAP